VARFVVVVVFLLAVATYPVLVLATARVLALLQRLEDKS
jgi:hypothetical protein